VRDRQRWRRGPAGPGLIGFTQADGRGSTRFGPRSQPSENLSFHPGARGPRRGNGSHLTVSLGSCPLWPDRSSDQRRNPSATHREAPLITGVNGPLMARRGELLNDLGALEAGSVYRPQFGLAGIVRAVSLSGWRENKVQVVMLRVLMTSMMTGS
jgi:hypothetical protein